MPVRRVFGWRPHALALALLALGAATAAALTPAEKSFATAYEKLVPALNRASASVVAAVDNSPKDTDAKVVTVFTSVARQWATATRPLLALTPPAPEAAIFAEAAHDTRGVESDLLAVAQSGRTNSVAAAKNAGRHLALDFNALAAQIKKLKARLGLH